eukprot:TRINITY_DN33491_c0_g1_i2.p1 TRINITY_DN33491_c0_g1~~TRINITY_DN33491_c0_g1_i2.p1  ORF type:complete len:246 (-),score=40.99 TRINITY_DN33491_c0_g1_i2:149-886(-)
MLKTLQVTLDRLIKENPDVRPERLVSAHLEAGTNPSTSEGTKGSSEFLKLAVHPTILDTVAQVIGPDFCLWGCQIFCKPGGEGMAVPMHQDGNYWPIRPLATVTVWVALDRSDKGNGCLQVVPKSHISKKGYQHYKSDKKDLVLNQAVTSEEMSSLEGAVDVELDAGQFSIHDVYLVHGSNANTSTRRRAGVALRYMPTTSVLERDLMASDAGAGYQIDWANRPIFLVRGTDKSKRNVMTPLPKF